VCAEHWSERGLEDSLIDVRSPKNIAIDAYRYARGAAGNDMNLAPREWRRLFPGKCPWSMNEDPQRFVSAEISRNRTTAESVGVILSSHSAMILKYDSSGMCPATASGEEAECFLPSTT